MSGFSRFLAACALAALLLSTFLPCTAAKVAAEEIEGLDPGWGVAGAVLVGFGNDAAAAVGKIFPLDDGKTLIVGTSDGMIGLQRLLADGSPDATLGGDGNIVVALGKISVSVLADALLQPDGKILVAVPDQGGYIARLNADGTLDNSFGVSGIASLIFNNMPIWARSVALAPDGSIVVGGEITVYDNNPEGEQELALSRFSSNGERVIDFGTDGVIVPFTHYSPDWHLDPQMQVHVRSDGRILAAVSSVAGFSVELVQMQYLPDGSPDETFGDQGKSVGGTHSSASILLSDGSLLVAGAIPFQLSRWWSYPVLSLERRLPDGAIDTNFGGPILPHYGGHTILVGSYIDATGLAATTDGGFVLSTATGFGRYTAEGWHDHTLAPDGWIDIPAREEDMGIVDIAVQNDGKILVLGAYEQSIIWRYSSSVPCTSSNFADVQENKYYFAAVDDLACRSAVSGYSDGTFKPDNPLTRGQLVKILGLVLNWNHYYYSVFPTSSAFRDTGSFDDWAAIAAAYGVVSGYADNTFRPYNPVTRGQLAKIVVTAMRWPLVETAVPHFSDVPSDNPFYSYIETAVAHQIINGYDDGTFRWQNSATRGQAAAIIYRAISQSAPEKGR